MNIYNIIRSKWASFKRWLSNKWHPRQEDIELAPIRSRDETTGVGKLILITGASHDITAHILNEFLEHGYSVRAAVGSQESADKTAIPYVKYGSRLTFVIIKDLASDHAFHDAAKGVDGVIHVWYPIIRRPLDNNRDLLHPGPQIILTILRAVAAHSPAVRRVVILSSFGAVVDLKKRGRPGYKYTEVDWTTVTYGEALEGSALVAHCRVQKVIEEIAFNFVNRNESNFHVTTLCPTVIYGPSAHPVDSLRNLSVTSKGLCGVIHGWLQPVPSASHHAFVDVRDLAAAHRLALESGSRVNQRYLITSSEYNYEMTYDIIRTEFPHLPLDKPNAQPQVWDPFQVYRVGNEKSVRELGMTYRSLQETVGDVVNEIAPLCETIWKDGWTWESYNAPKEANDESRGDHVNPAEAPRVEFALPGDDSWSPTLMSILARIGDD